MMRNRHNSILLLIWNHSRNFVLFFFRFVRESWSDSFVCFNKHPCILKVHNTIIRTFWCILSKLFTLLFICTRVPRPIINLVLFQYILIAFLIFQLFIWCVEHALINITFFSVWSLWPSRNKQCPHLWLFLLYLLCFM